MNPALLLDPKLMFVAVLAGALALLGTLNIAARPAAVISGRVALAFSVSSIFFMISRLANLFYLPLMARFMDEAERTGQTAVLWDQVRWVIVGTAVGSLASWLLLGNFVSLYLLGIKKVEERGSMLRALLWAAHPRAWKPLLKAFLAPVRMGVKLFHLKGIPVTFLLANVFAGSVWTCGALSALLVSAQTPQYAATAVLLSGLVNAFAAIAFSVWVDPKAAHITDQAVSGERSEEDVRITAVHLGLGNFIGGLLGLVMLYPATWLITKATLAVGAQGGTFSDSLWIVMALNLFVTMLASTTYAARVSAVVTRRVAMAMAIYNLFFLVTRLAQQVYAPMLGAVRDHLVARGDLGALEGLFRQVILGASVGVFVGLLLLPTFVEVYNRAITALDRLGSIPAVLFASLHPRSWPTIAGCLRPPGLFGVKLSEIKELPQGFLWGNLLVISIHTVGVMAAIYAGAQNDELARTATLLSSVVNGLATITLSIIVDPMCALITDQTVKGERPGRHIYIMAVVLLFGMLFGTLLAQVVFKPAVWVIDLGAQMLDKVF